MFWDKLCIVNPSNNLIISKYKKCTLPIQVRNNTPNSPDRCKLYNERTPFIWNTLYLPVVAKFRPSPYHTDPSGLWYWLVFNRFIVVLFTNKCTLLITFNGENMRKTLMKEMPNWSIMEEAANNCCNFCIFLGSKHWFNLEKPCEMEHVVSSVSCVHSLIVTLKCTTLLGHLNIGTLIVLSSWVLLQNNGRGP